MNIVVFGLGHIGLVAACCLVKEGHSVIGIDTDATKVDTISNGISPFTEPDLPSLLTAALANHQLSVQTALGNALHQADAIFVCVRTPVAANGVVDLSDIITVSHTIAGADYGARTHPLAVIYRSTIPPGTMRDTIAPIFAPYAAQHRFAFELVFNPEFLREGAAIHDYFNPARIIIGTEHGTASAVMDKIYTPYNVPVFYTPHTQAEFAKLVDNAWRATKVVFANEIGRLCRHFGISAQTAHMLFVADRQFNISAHHTRPGAAFGGSCLPKDVRALDKMAWDAGLDTHLLHSLLPANQAHKEYQFQTAIDGLPEGASVLLVGLAFKSDTSDIRESPYIDLALTLLQAGFAVSVYDPFVSPASLVSYAAETSTENDLIRLMQCFIDKDQAQKTNWLRIVVNNPMITDIDYPQDRTFHVHTLP